MNTKFDVSSRWQVIGSVVLVVVACAFGAAPATADHFDYSIDFGNLGQQENFSCPDTPIEGGACGAVASINSFAFLQNEYPEIYDDLLLPNYDQFTMTDMEDAEDFALDGWQVGTNPMRQGFYSRPADDDGGRSNFWDTKSQWVNDHAPRSTRFNSWWTPMDLNDDGQIDADNDFTGSSPHNNRHVTIQDLAREMKHGEDVEFFVLDDAGDFYHALTLTGVSHGADGNFYIQYQDPNDPSVNQGPVQVALQGGILTFTGVPGSGEPTLEVQIVAAYSESPVPEPATIALLATGVLGLLVRSRQRG